MKGKKVLPLIILFVSLLFVSCATTQKLSTKVIPDTARIVKIWVPGCS